MHVRHEEAVPAYGRLERLCRAAVDGRVLADRRAIADFDSGVLALVLEILRIAAQDGADAHFHAGAERHVLLERHARTNATPIAENAVLADDDEGANLHVLAELCVAVDNGRAMNASAHRSRTIAPISASQTISPSNLATPDILHIVPRTCTR